jgi:hypothetical protein
MERQMIMSVAEIVRLMREQANLRSPENDDAGLLQDLADQLAREHRELHAGEDASDF